MLIDPLTIKFSGKRRYDILSADQLPLIEGWKTALTSVGWALKQSLHATGFVDYPLSAPVVDGGTQTPKTIVGCNTFVTIGSATFTLYDFGRQEPASFSPCQFVPMGTSGFTTLSNLAVAISLFTDFTATVEVVDSIHLILRLTAKLAGAIGNDVNIQGDGRFGQGSGISTGGGYQLESASGASIYQCALTWQTTFPGSLNFDFVLNGSPAKLILQASNEPNSGTPIGGYSLICNGYGFFLWDGAEIESGAPYRSNSVFAMAPFKPTADDLPDGEIFDTTAYAVFLMGTPFRSNTAWFQNCGTCLDSYADQYSNIGGWPRNLAIRSAGAPLLTPAGRPLVIGSYIMFGQNRNSGAFLVGKLWDCAIVHDVVSDVMIMGQRFVPVASLASSGGSLTTTLMMCVPSAGAPRKSGQVSTVNSPPGKASVFYVGGQNFSGLSAGDPITINGVPNVVDSITDDLALTVANPIVPALTSVDYTVP